MFEDREDFVSHMRREGELLSKAQNLLLSLPDREIRRWAENILFSFDKYLRISFILETEGADEVIKKLEADSR